MGMVRHLLRPVETHLRLLPALLLATASVARATPVDVAWDFVDAVERCDGETVASMLSSDLLALLDSTLTRLQAVASEDGVLARELLESYGLEAEPWEITTWDTGGLIGVVLRSRGVLRTDLLGPVEEERTSMRGRSASVTLVWSGGFSIGFDMIWEDGDWRISGTSLLTAWF